MINYDHPLSRPLATQQHIEGPKWLTLASPNLYVYPTRLSAKMSIDIPGSIRSFQHSSQPREMPRPHRLPAHP